MGVNIEYEYLYSHLTDSSTDNRYRVSLIPPARLRACNFTIPADPSSAAFLTVAALITADSEIIMENICINETRIGIYQSLIEMGGRIKFQNIRYNDFGEKIADIYVKSSRLANIKIDAGTVVSMIDEIPIFAIAAAAALGNCYIEGLSELQYKESNRLNAILENLSAIGVKVESENNNLKIFGTGSAYYIKGNAFIKAKGDHRIIMSFLIAGLVAKEKIIIDDITAINTSFPNFLSIVKNAIIK